MLFGSDLCEDKRAPFELSVTTATISTILCVITVPGNVLICLAIVKDPNKELRSAFNYLVLNLALADLITGICTEPVFVVFHVRSFKIRRNEPRRGRSCSLLHQLHCLYA